MKLAVTVFSRGEDHGVLFGPEVPLREQVRRFKEIRSAGGKVPDGEPVDSLELWERNQGRLKRCSFLSRSSGKAVDRKDVAKQAAQGARLLAVLKKVEEAYALDRSAANKAAVKTARDDLTQFRESAVMEAALAMAEAADAKAREKAQAAKASRKKGADKPRKVSPAPPVKDDSAGSIQEGMKL